MVGSKEHFLDLRQKEWWVRMGNEAYEGLVANYPAIIKDSKVSYEGEHNFLMENSKEYRDYYKTKKEATKEIDKIKQIYRERARRNS